MQWVNPAWLWGLLGLAVPVAIHLLSRKEGKVVKVGSLRHLSESATRQFRSLKPNEWLLFVLRSLLIIFLIALLAELQWERKQERAKWILLERGTERNPQAVRLIDSLLAHGYEKRYFEQGFPLPEDTMGKTNTVNYWYLASQLGEANLEHAVIFSHSLLRHFRGKRESLPANTSWVDVPAEQKTFEVALVPEKTDSVFSLSGNSDAEILYVEKTVLNGASAVDAVDVPTVEVTLVVGQGFEQDAAILEAALRVLDEAPLYRIIVNRATPADSLSGWVFWFSKDPLPEVSGSRNVIFGEQNRDKLIEQTGASSWQITRRLNRETAIEHNLVVELGRLLATNEPPQFAKNDSRGMPEAWRWAEPETMQAEPTGKATAYTSVSQWLALLFLVTLLSERVVAWRRNQ